MILFWANYAFCLWKLRNTSSLETGRAYRPRLSTINYRCSLTFFLYLCSYIALHIHSSHRCSCFGGSASNFQLPGTWPWYGLMYKLFFLSYQLSKRFCLGGIVIQEHNLDLLHGGLEVLLVTNDFLQGARRLYHFQLFIIYSSLMKHQQIGTTNIINLGVQ